MQVETLSVAKDFAMDALCSALAKSGGFALLCSQWIAIEDGCANPIDSSLPFIMQGSRHPITHPTLKTETHHWPNQYWKSAVSSPRGVVNYKQESLSLQPPRLLLSLVWETSSSHQCLT